MSECYLCGSSDATKTICYECYELQPKLHQRIDRLKARVAELETALDRVLTQMQLVANMVDDPLVEKTILEIAPQVSKALEGSAK